MYRTFLFLFLLILNSCSSAQVENKSYELMLQGLLSHSVSEASVSEIQNKSSTYTLLDAREEAEFNVSHLQKAIHVGYDQFDLNTLEGINKDEPIIVYCSVGYRSEKIAERLIAAGYSNVQNLYGGIFEWKNQGFEVYDDSGKTDSVHAYDTTWGIWLHEGEKVYD